MNKHMDGKTRELFLRALAVRKNAYVPYSNFQVGAALLTASGATFVGTNVENASYGLTNCAERSCLFSYISAGAKDDLITNFLVVGDTPEPISPCGACRQVMSEFLSQEAQITLANLNGDFIQMRLTDLIPYYFKKGDLLDEQ